MANKRFTIGIDVDGVLCNFCYGARELCKQLFDGRPDDSLVQTGWSFESLGITHDEESQMWDVIDQTPNWWMGLTKLPDTGSLVQLCEEHRVIFITNRKDGSGLPVDRQTFHWLLKHYRNIPSPTVVLSTRKGSIAKGLNLDYFIDDRIKNVQEVVDALPSCKTFIQDGTYNKEYKRAPRVQNFNEFAQIITEASRV